MIINGITYFDPSVAMGSGSFDGGFESIRNWANIRTSYIN